MAGLLLSCMHMDAFNEFITGVTREIVDPIITLLTLAAVIYFVWGVTMFIKNSDNEEKRDTGKRHMIYGIIGLAIMFGAFAIVGFLKNIVGLE